jgi:hypothetical protein
MISASASRVTRSERSLRLGLLLFAGVLAGVTVLRAQEPPPPAPAARTVPASNPSTAEPPAQPGAAAPDEAAAKQADTPDETASTEAARPAATERDDVADQAAAPPAGPSPARFEPTEKVRADFDVAFPIDI